MDSYFPSVAIHTPNGFIYYDITTKICHMKATYMYPVCQVYWFIQNLLIVEAHLLLQMDNNKFYWFFARMYLPLINLWSCLLLDFTIAQYLHSAYIHVKCISPYLNAHCCQQSGIQVTVFFMDFYYTHCIPSSHACTMYVWAWLSGVQDHWLAWPHHDIFHVL